MSVGCGHSTDPDRSYFQRGPAAFLSRVVPAHPGPPDLQPHVQVTTRAVQLVRGVLAAAVGAEDDPGGVTVTERDRPPQGVLDDVGVQAVAERVPEYPARAAIADRTQVQPALPGGQVGDVAGPYPVQLAPGRSGALAGPVWCAGTGQRSW